MSTASDSPDRAEEMLAELAELDLAFARHVQAKALATEDLDEINALGRTYQRVARSLRQTLALKARLAREREAVAADRPKAPAVFSARAADQRMADLRDAVRRVAWSEYEPSELEGFDDYLDEVLCDLAIEPDFMTRDLEAQIVRACALLDLPTRNAHRWRDLPDPAEPSAALEPAVQDTG